MPETSAGLAAWWGGLGAGTQAAVGAVGAATAGAGVSAALAPKAPKPPPPPPMLQAPDGTGAANAVALKARGASGMAGTNLTGPQGLTDPATTAPKTLLGA